MKEKIVNTLALETQTVSVTHLNFPYNVTAAIDNTEIIGDDCVPIKIYLQKQELGSIWSLDCHLLTTVLVHRR